LIYLLHSGPPPPAEQKAADGLSNSPQAYWLVSAGQRAWANRGDLFRAGAANPGAFMVRGVQPAKARLVPLVRKW
jgi:hypothetical protein